MVGDANTFLAPASSLDGLRKFLLITGSLLFCLIAESLLCKIAPASTGPNSAPMSINIWVTWWKPLPDTISNEHISREHGSIHGSVNFDLTSCGTLLGSQHMKRLKVFMEVWGLAHMGCTMLDVPVLCLS